MGQLYWQVIHVTQLNIAGTLDANQHAMIQSR
nr:MAG TPA: hypothetical protein [Caudoviricetes sp.]